MAAQLHNVDEGADLEDQLGSDAFPLRPEPCFDASVRLSNSGQTFTRAVLAFDGTDTNGDLLQALHKWALAKKLERYDRWSPADRALSSALDREIEVMAQAVADGDLVLP